MRALVNIHSQGYLACIHVVSVHASIEQEGRLGSARNSDSSIAIMAHDAYNADMRRKPFSDELRDAVNQSGRSYYDLAAAMKTPPSTVSRFANGGRGLSLEMLDRLAEILDIHAVVDKGD